MKKVLIILGMHRSGTSLVSNWLSKCNLKLGDRLLGEGFSNKNGHFEDLDFLHLHQQILKHYQIIDTGLIPPFDFEFNDYYYYNKFKNNINFKNSLYEQWGWKEPRTCLFIKYYRELLPEAKYLILFRDYLPVVESLIKREYITLNLQYYKLTRSQQNVQRAAFENKLKNLELLCNTYLKTWIVYNQHIIDHINTIANNDYTLLTYDHLIKNDKEIFQTLINWKFELEYYPFISVYDASLVSNESLDITFDPILESEAIRVNNELLKLKANKHSLAK